jgi:hypothetical protein
VLSAFLSGVRAMRSTDSLGEIRPDTLYPLSVFQARVGWGERAMRQARRNGLIVRRLGVRSYVMGSDFLMYFNQHSEIVTGNEAHFDRSHT